MALPVLAAAFCLAIEGVSIAGLVTKAATTCKIIEDSISTNSTVVYPASTYQFGNDTHHWMSSSSQTPTCVLEPGSPEDLSIAVSFSLPLRGVRESIFPDGSQCLDAGYWVLKNALCYHVWRALVQPRVLQHNWCPCLAQALQPTCVLRRQLHGRGRHWMGKISLRCLGALLTIYRCVYAPDLGRLVHST